MTERPDPARVEALFDELVDRPPEEAARRLVEACAHEPALRGAVERLLAGDRAARPSFLAPSPELLAEAARDRIARAETVAAGSESPNGDPARGAQGPVSLHAATRVGRFSLLRRLGQGGMGVVYLGYDEGLDRRAAIKVLQQGLAAPERLVREAQALAKLSHPNVVPVYEVGEHRGHVFLAMEFVDGPTLRGFLAEKRPVEDILAVFVEAGRGLMAAHDAGIVHRDFKPDNVLVGKDGRPRVADFGIAGSAQSGADVHRSPVDFDDPSLTKSGSAFAAPLTRAGALLGTPAFMSPEQFRGERATPASDQFSFCVALYEAIYGVAPFGGKTLAELISNVIHGSMKPPPKAPAAPARLAAILRRGLSANPADRYPNVGTLLDALTGLLPPHPDLDPQRTRRPRWILGTIILALAAVLTALVAARGAERQFTSAWDLVVFGVILFVVGGTTIAFLWKRLATNLAGRRFAYVFLVGLALLVVQRVVGAVIGLSVRQVITLDILHVASMLGLSAVVVEKWFALIGALGLVALLAATIVPEWAISAFGYYTLLATAAAVFALPRARR